MPSFWTTRMAPCALAIVARTDRATRRTSIISIPPREDEPMAIEYDMARMADVRPKILLADDIGMSRMHSCLDFMRLNTDQRPVHIESQRGPNIRYWDERFFRSVWRWRGGATFLGHIDGLDRM